jgi:protein arginine kinase activator
MNCQLCGKRPASIHYTELSGSAAAEYHICQECAQEKGLFKASTGPVKVSVTEILAGMSGASAAQDASYANVVCPACGETYAEFRESGRMGCGECYDAFADLLRPLLRRIHGSTQHAGKKPSDHRPAAPTPKSDLARLREELRRALEREDFERCAEIRDRMRKAGDTGGAS